MLDRFSVSSVRPKALLFRAARLSATGRAPRRGPKATLKPALRLGVGRACGRSGVPRVLPRKSPKRRNDARFTSEP
jgi:hypothetical protein